MQNYFTLRLSISKLDLKKELAEFYRANAKKPKIGDLQEGKFVTITGRGAPSRSTYQPALNALYSAAYTMKFRSKPRERTSQS